MPPSPTPPENLPLSHSLLRFFGLGVGAGLVFGLAFDSLTVGLSMGLGFAMGFGNLGGPRKRNEPNQSPAGIQL